MSVSGREPGPHWARGVACGVLAAAQALALDMLCWSNALACLAARLGDAPTSGTESSRRTTALWPMRGIECRGYPAGMVRAPTKGRARETHGIGSDAALPGSASPPVTRKPWGAPIRIDRQPHTPARVRAAAVVLLAALVALAVGNSATARPADVTAAGRTQSTQLISRAQGGGTPNGASTNPVISNDKRYVRAIAFESDASDLVSGDNNRMKDVFAVRRGNSANNKGTAWKPGRNVLMSRTRSGAPANGPSSSPSIDGSFHTKPTCVAFLSAASNLVSGDTNGQVDAFVKKISSGAPKRLRPKGAQPKAPATAVAVSGDCKVIAFVQGGKLYVSKRGRRAKRLKTRGTAASPSFGTGLRNDLVYSARGGVYLRKNGTGRARLVGRGGRNPAYNDIKRQTVAYEKKRGGHWQIGYHDIGKRERIISAFHGRVGNGDSRNPVVGNSGYYVTFESDASNLQTSAAGSSNDNNGAPDVFLYTDTRKITLVQSVDSPGDLLPAGGKNPGMSFYANYIVFDSPAPIGSRTGTVQILMRYLGGI